MRRLITVLPPLLFLALAGAFYWGIQRGDGDALPSALIGQPAPALRALPLSGAPEFDPSVLADGQVKLVNFWASWCAPCRAEHPNLVQLADQLPIYGVNKSDKPAAAAAFLQQLGNPYTGVTRDPDGRQAVDWGVYGLPETFVIDGQGRIVLRVAGALTQRRLEDVLQPAIDQARAAQ